MQPLTPERASEAMRQAIALAYEGPRSANPRVGCVILDVDGQMVGAGFHHGAGTAHAEVEALAAAGDRSRGATAIVTLEPCNHVGRTGPCTQALIAAGISRVVFAQSDPTPQASGGATVLRRAGIEVIEGVQRAEANEINKAWTHVQLSGRPYVVLKLAHTIDARVADGDSGPTAISGPQARVFTHELRAQSDAVLVGTATAMADDPQLTVRELSVETQPLRVVMGERELPGGLRVLNNAAPTLLIRDRHPLIALGMLRERGVQQVLLEGGPTLASAFLEADCVDELVWFIAPALMGAGVASSHPMTRTFPVDVSEVRLIGNDVMVRGQISRGA
ncbi:MAG: bifunctional diaminohydroxyphosphoribosylaminopyrimidine deaminase/5-amino-6-(5-phosphoribosylamino)uracil reductase RibD [Actinomycetota bacterium]|nr:bifunctional diaminohydroxyphosphoribosylaminopyrimidine deaminase/5-amino-6-(5-phosphoribosylamino)uracil reductase RibD [Actinomycetota bacterium]MDP2288434.1 bifunctional diaminohydroxyphosphoribosylaminopyrimidine deaminase/5-amino-6-(5-phosphoribosylamino)uracil reductase RibD [Actinomycetota bacterium]